MKVTPDNRIVVLGYVCPITGDVYFTDILPIVRTDLEWFGCKCGYAHPIYKEMREGLLENDFITGSEVNVVAQVGRFQAMHFDEFIAWYKANSPSRFITELHMHHCWKPDKHTYLISEDKVKVIENVYRMDKDVRGLDDFGQNVLITPDGMIWSCLDFNSIPSSIKGRNGNGKFGPLSVTILGNFDKDKEALDGIQRDTLLSVLKFVMDFHGIEDDKFIFHREHSPRTSPGSSIDKQQLLYEVRLMPNLVKPFMLLRDVQSDHPHADAIRVAVENGVMQVFPDGSFYPNSLATRGDLANLYKALMETKK